MKRMLLIRRFAKGLLDNELPFIVDAMLKMDDDDFMCAVSHLHENGLFDMPQKVHVHTKDRLMEIVTKEDRMREEKRSTKAWRSRMHRLWGMDPIWVGRETNVYDSYMVADEDVTEENVANYTLLPKWNPLLYLAQTYEEFKAWEESEE